MLYRQVNDSYRETYERLKSSVLYEKLTGHGLLIAHDEVDIAPISGSAAYKVLRPEPIPFVSHPYEWSFGMLKDAALLTLEIQSRSIEHGMTLKDASAYNVQFEAGQPIWIDTLSFEPLREGEPWVAYRQFCQHFLAPLALMVYRDLRIISLLRIHIDGIPLDLASRLLPLRTWFKFPLLTHLHLHAKAQRRFAGQRIDQARRERGMRRTSLLGLIDSLRSAVQALNWLAAKTPWSDYSDTHNYSKEARQHKLELVGEYLDEASPEVVWDLGANVGTFSRLVSQRGALCVAFDADPGAVELNYQAVKREGETRVLPLLLDLTNPSPALGWAHEERESLMERGPTHVVMALALVHHLAISNNVPLAVLAEFLARLGEWLIIEFVPKQDSQVKKLLVSREDIFSDYHVEGFETAFSEHFSFVRKCNVQASDRVIYLMRFKKL